MDIVDVLTEAGLTPEQIDQIMQTGVLEGQTQKIIPRQQAMADYLRETPTPRGRAYGGVYRAAHPLEHLGAGLQSAAGFYGDWKANQRQQEILEGQKAGRRSLLDALIYNRSATAGMP